MKQEKKYDLFISYTDTDKAWVEGYLIDSLRQANIHYHSEAAFTLGAPRLKEFEDAIQSSQRTLLIISPDYLGDNCTEFIDLLGQSYGLETATWPVIPLMLHPVKLPTRLAMLTYLDATDDTQWSEVIECLCADLQRPVPPPPPKPECPYPGMMPFNESNSDRFFGREQEVEYLLEHLYQHQFITVIGSSGSGKSSLIFAGLIPKLRQTQRFGSGEWLIHTMRPGETPFSVLKTTLGSEQTDVSLAVAKALNTQPNSQRLLLIIDQYEELFTISQIEKEEFQQVLLRLLQLQNCYLILTVRADFYADLMQCPLWENIQLHRLEVVPLDEKGLQKAILKPADNMGVFIESALVERLVKDAVGEPGVLPLIQETMVLLWEKLQRRFLPLKAYETLVLSRKDYDTLGNNQRTGLQVAIANHADAALTDLRQENEEQGVIARRIFLRLVQFGEGRADTRRQQTENALRAGNDPYLFDKTLSHLVNRRLLTLSAGEDSTRKVDIAHEALISGWPTLQQWLTERREAELTRRRLETKAEEWERLGQGNGGLLDEVQLAEAQGWLKSPDAIELGIDQKISAFVQVSDKAILRELQQQKKVNRILRFFIIMLGGAVLLVLNQTINANIKTLEAQSASSKANFIGGEQLQALISSIEAGKLLKWMPFLPLNIKQQVLQTLQQTVYKNREINRLQGHTDWIVGLSFNHDGTLLASASKDKTVKIWNLKGEEIITLPHDSRLNDVSFSPQANILVSASEDKKIRLWDLNGKLLNVFPAFKEAPQEVSFAPNGKLIIVSSIEGTFILNLKGEKIKFISNKNKDSISSKFSADSQFFLSSGENHSVEIRRLDGKLINILKGHKNFIYIATFNSDGQIIATGSEDTTVKIWKRDGTLIKILSHNQPVTRITFSNDDQMLISGTLDGTIYLWNIKDKTLIQKWKAHIGTITDIKISPDSKIIASSGIDNTIRLWNIQGNNLGKHKDWVRSVNFSPDGKSIVSGSADQTVKIWDLNGQLIKNITGHTDKIWSVDFSPDGKSIVSGSADQTVKIWKLNETLVQTLKDHTDEVTTVKYSPDGKKIATGSIDQTIKIWNADNGKLLNSFNAHDDTITQLSFSPDDKTIVTASNDTTVKLWDLDGELLETFDGHKDIVNDVSFSPDGKMIASASDDNTIKLWNINGKLLRTLTGHKAKVWTVSFSPDGKMIASGSDDMTIKLWNLDGEELATFQSDSYILSVSFSPDSKKIVSGDFNGVVALWNLDLDDLLKRGCEQLRPYLSNQANKNQYQKLCQ
jgi:WD40 repeat protein